VNTRPWYEWRDNSLFLELHLQPKASKDAVAGLHAQRLKITITAPPVDGKANAHLCAWLAKQFGVAKSRVHICKGELGRDKQIRIEQPSTQPDWFIRLQTENET